MARPWSAVSASPEFQALPAADQESARQQYFSQVVAPQLSEDDLPAARAQFDQQTRIAKVDLPAGVAPSDAGAGRGSINPPPPPPVAKYGEGVRRGSMRAVKPVVAGDERIVAPPAAPKPTGSVLDRPVPGFQPSEADLVQASKAPEAIAREHAAAVVQASRASAPSLKAAPERGVAQQMLDATIAKPLDGSLGAAALEMGGDAARGVVRASQTLGGSALSAAEAGLNAVGAGDTDVARIFGLGGEAARRARTQWGNAKDPGSLTQQVFESTFTSVPLTLALGAGNASLLAIGAQSAANEFGESRDRGLSASDAAERAAFMGTAEMIGERFGLPQLQKLFAKAAAKASTKEMGGILADLLMKEQVGEQVTTALQSGHEKFGNLGQRPDMTLADYLEDAATTAKVTLGQTLLTGGAAAGVKKLAGKPKQTAEDLARSKGFLARKPSQIIGDAHSGFDELAAAYGLPKAAVAAAKAKTDGTPADQVQGFLTRAAQAFGKRGMFAKPLDDAALKMLEPQAEEDAEAPAQPPLSSSMAAPEAPAPGEQDFSGLADEAEPIGVAAVPQGQLAASAETELPRQPTSVPTVAQAPPADIPPAVNITGATDGQSPDAGRPDGARPVDDAAGLADEPAPRPDARDGAAQLEAGGDAALTGDAKSPEALRTGDKGLSQKGAAPWEMTRAEYRRNQFNEDEHRHLPPDYFDSSEMLGGSIADYPAVISEINGTEFRRWKHGGVGAFRDGKQIGFADNGSFNVAKENQGQGVGLELMRIVKEGNPSHRVGSHTPAGGALMMAYHRDQVKQALAEGETVPPAVLAEYPELGTLVQSDAAASGTFGPGHRLSGQPRTAGGIPADTLRTEVAKIVDGWKNGPPIEVVDTAASLPEHIRKALQSQDAAGEARALLDPDNGRVYLIADKLPDMETAQFALFHEVYGHHGLRMIFGPTTYAQEMTRLRLSNPKLAAEAKAWMDANGEAEIAARVEAGMSEDAARQEVRLLSVEEALADRAGNPEPIGGWRGFMARLQKVLRLLGLDAVANRLESLTQAETLDLLARARAAVQNGDVAQTGGESLKLSRAVREQGIPREAKWITSFTHADKLKTHPDYVAAKAGDPEAAARLVTDLVSENDLEAARGLGEALWVFPHAEEASGRNAIPAMLAARYAAETDGTLDEDIVQTNRVFHTGADAMQRLSARPMFDGAVQAGKRYVLVDDVTTMGGTLAELADHIRAGGGEIAGVVTLVNAARGALPKNASTPTMTPSAKQIAEIERRYGQVLRETLNVAPGALTGPEASYVIGFRDADEIRNRVTAAKQARADRLRSKGVPPQVPRLSRVPQTETPEFKAWFGDSKVVDGEGRPLLMYHGTTNVDSILESGFRNGWVHLTDSKPVADSYQEWARGGSAGTLAVYVKAVNPAYFDAEGKKYTDNMSYKIFNATADAEKAGHDALIIKNIRDHFDSSVPTKPHMTVVAFRPEQIKSATDNRGTFDPKSPNILLSRQPRYSKTQQDALARAGIGGKPGLSAKIRQHWGVAKDTIRNRGDLTDAFRQGALDQFFGIKKAVDREIGALPADQDPYVTARLANGGTSSVMRALLLHGQAKWAANGQHLEKIDGTRGLLEILSPLGDDLNAWFGWMIGNRAARLKAEGRERNFTDAQITALKSLAIGKEAKFQKAALEYAAFKRSVLDVAQQAGLIDPEGRKAWDHADYIPFYRQIDEKATFSATGRKGLAGQSSGIRTLKGGEAALNDPMENLLMNFSRLIDASLKNNALRKTIDALKDTDVVEKTGYEMKGEVIPAGQVKKALVEAGTPAVVLDFIPPQAFEGMAKMWAIKPPTDPDVIRVMVDGKPQFWRVHDPLLLKAATSFVPFDFPGLGVMRAFKRVLTAAVTATPEFMARNFIRDSMASQMITRDGFSPHKSLAGIAKSYSGEGGFEPMLFAGASFQSGNVNAADPTGTANAMRRALRSKGFDASSADAFIASLLDTPLKVWEKYRDVGEAIENANREAVFDAALKEGTSVTGAAFEAKDLMDFNLRGSAAAYQILADVLPFFNARVQGLYRLARSNPKRLVAYGLMMTAASVLLALANAGEDWYEELPDWDKDTFWHFKIDGHHFRIPKPFELGAVFATVPERITRYIKGLDAGKKTAERLWATARDQLAFDPVPQAIRPGLNVWANKDTFRDSPIENMSDEGKLPSMRFSKTTSDTAKAVVKAVAPVADEVGLSPKRLEYLVGGYLGTAGLYALGLSDMAVRQLQGGAPRPSPRLDDIPVIKAFYRVDPARGTMFESDLYKMREEIEQVYRSIKAAEREGDVVQREELVGKNLDKLAARDTVNTGANLLRGMNKERDAIYDDRSMSPDEKRKRVDALQAKKNEIARQTMRSPPVKAAQ